MLVPSLISYFCHSDNMPDSKPSDAKHPSVDADTTPAIEPEPVAAGQRVAQSQPKIKLEVNSEMRPK